MAQPNVAREPSMDEILASIRKIIESNEPGIPGFPANDIGTPSFRSASFDEDAHMEDIRLTIDDEELAAEFEAQERQLEEDAMRNVPVAAPRVEAPVVDMAPPQSLADVAARVRAASERHATAARETDMEIENRLRGVSPVAAARVAPASAPIAAERPISNAALTEASAHPSAKLAEATAVEQAKADAPAKMVSDAGHEVPAIVSPSVGAQVARSFDDLAQALDAGPRRSFDEIAQDMLRPMLQEWLDDNLPTLVERLVREEIERVARGPRRG